MRFPLLLILLGISLGNGSTMPELKIATVRSWQGRLPGEKQTEFIQADRKRTEAQRKFLHSLWPGGPMILVQGPRTASIVRCDLGQMFILNLDRRTYSSTPYPRVPSEAERRAYAERVSKEPARKPTVTVEISTVDTGERKEIFGHTARHIVTTRRESPLEGSIQPPKEYVTDGWYIDLDTSLSCDPERPAGSFSYAFLTTSVNGRFADVPDLKLVGKPENGFALSTTMTSRLTYVRGDGTKQADVSVNATEVVGLSMVPLYPALFEIPAGFTRVDQIDFSPSIPLWARWLSQAHTYWLRFKKSISRH
jgi:hypothetical protein